MGMFDFLTHGSDEKNEPEKVEPGIVQSPQEETKSPTQFVRYEKNPIIFPDSGIAWKSKATYNPAAIFLSGKVHLLYRAQGEDKVSSFGYASSTDGYTFSDFSREPVYVPREPFEMMTAPGWNSGCEDPRITKIGEKLYMCYTAYDGTNPPRIALTSITVENFLQKNWDWEKPKLISPPGVDDKDSCIIQSGSGSLFAFHRLGNVIWFDPLKNLNFPEKKFLTGGIMAQARADSWDNVKIGIAAPPLLTKRGWLLLYHAVSNPGFVYKIGAMILDFSDPRKILARSASPILEPVMQYEKEGQVKDIVFSCGAVEMDGTVFLYYGGADTVVGVATMPLELLLDSCERVTP